VITAAEPVMLIVPMNESLTLEARVAPHEIDQLSTGRDAVVRIHASNQRTTPELKGTVSRISADVTREQQTGLNYYTIRIDVPAEQIARLEGIRLVAGMQADVFVQTHDRTPLQYLIKPLQDQIARAFRES
jgi:HlyD family secretion protein